MKFGFSISEAALYRWGYTRPLARKNLLCTLKYKKHRFSIRSNLKSPYIEKKKPRKSVNLQGLSFLSFQ